MTFTRAMEMEGVGQTPAPVSARPEARPARTRPGGPSLTPLIAALVVGLMTCLSIRWGAGPAPVAIWIANAFAAGVWLKSGRGRSFDLSFGGLMLVGILFGELLADNPPVTSLALAMANLVEIYLTVVLVRRLEPSLSVSSVRATLNVLLAVGLSALGGGLVGALFFQLLRGVPYLDALQMWLFGHALGLFLVVPMLLSFDRRILVGLLRSRARQIEAVLLLGGALALAWVLCAYVSAPVAFLMNPVLLIVAVRLRVWALSLVMLMVSFCVLSGLGDGPGTASTIGMDSSMRIVLAQLMLLFAATPYMVVAALIEERDRLWAQARAGLARAERASEAKSRLLANVAHEIKSPVAGIIGIGDLWSSGQLGPVSKTQGEMAEMLVKTARQVETLAHDLLDVARAESGAIKVEPRPTEIVGLVEDVRRSAVLRPEARGMAIEVLSEAPAMVALADSQRLRQVVDNLTVNALKYGASGQSVVLSVRRCPLGVRIEVIDRGPGLSPEKQAQLFEPFNRLGLERSSIEGHGVGLALARRLVELQGGEIGVVSAPGEGALFWVELPAA